MTTSLILSTALGLWPENEPKPTFKHYQGTEWACGHGVMAYADTLEEALYRYAIMCEAAAGQIVPSVNYGPVLDFLGDHVEDPLFIQANP